jgi:hypothetical protein
MGKWIKETDKAIYLMDDEYYVDAIPKRPSSTSAVEQVANITAMKSWFAREDKPQRVMIAVGIGSPEPEPLPPPSPPPSIGIDNNPPPRHQGMQLRVIKPTFFKLVPSNPTDLTDAQKVLVQDESVFDIQFYTEVANNHWLVELYEATLGDKRTFSWYVLAADVELLSRTVLTVVSDTLFKLEPKLSINLPNSSKVFVKNGTRFPLVSFEPAAGNHTRIELASTTLGINKDVIWYAFSPDVTIQGQRQTLRVVSDTIFKTRPVQSTELPNAEKIFVRNRTVFLVNSYAQPEGFHMRVALQGAFLGPQRRNTWYCFVPDIEINGTELGNRPNDTPSLGGGGSGRPGDRGIAMTFPGFEGVYYSNDPIYFQTQYGDRGNFTWGEALHADPATGLYRRPAEPAVVYGILRIAKVMEDIQRRYGKRTIQINSWYRDPVTNAAVGGASQSRHLVGDAVDFVVPGIHPYDVYADLDPWWGSRGGLASSTVFTHIDMRGYRARWDYGY